MCANALIEWVAWDVWQCHGSRAGINLAQGMGDKEGAAPSRMRPLRYQFGGPTRIRTWSLSIMSRSR